MIFAWLAIGLAVATSAQQQVEYTSPLGKTFYARVVRPELLSEMERKLAAAPIRSRLTNGPSAA